MRKTQRHGEPVAESHPISPFPRIANDKKSEIFESMEAFWRTVPELGDGTRILDDDRSRG
jgi:hypothetical protein